MAYFLLHTSPGTVWIDLELQKRVILKHIFLPELDIWNDAWRDKQQMFDYTNKL